VKILVVRFSSIGDVVLTSPILRSIKTSFPESELHFLVKAKFLDAVRHNPRVDKIHVPERGITRILRRERYDWVLDLQKNVRSTRLTSFLGARRATIDKQNFKKWRMVWLKSGETVPHIVERYAEALKPLDIRLDDGGLEYFVAGESEIAADDYFRGERRIPVGMALGANYATKRWPLWTELATLIDPERYVPVLLGGPMDVAAADAFVRYFPTAINAVGRCNLNVSAALVKRCRAIITPDTGLMHIAAALGIPIVILWGNTVPAFGMYPYRARYVALENALPCRPCSKLGFAACPRQHFHCMTLTRPESVWEATLKVLAQESS
jgi:ADP-heptose:LPS heptosyltransferase